MTHVAEAQLPAAPERFGFSTGAKLVAAVFVAAGMGAFFWALYGGHPELAWSSYLIGAFYTLGLAVFGAIWLSILNLSRGVWSVTMRRVPEAMAAVILPAGVLAMLVLLGAHSLYHWTHAEAVAADELLTHKAPFLNTTVFLVAGSGTFVLWTLFSFFLLRNSRKQDATGSVRHTRRNMVLSAVFAVVFALTLSAVSYLFLMSLDAHWFSTMFAVVTFTDLMHSGLAVVCIVAGIFILRGRLSGFLNENHLHSAGKMLFAVTGFWAYIYFCQFLLIWYGGIPEETIYFIKRWENGWTAYLLVLPLIKFVIPFIYLVPRNNKRKPKRLIPAAMLILFAQFWELYLMVGPSIGHGAHAAHGHLPWHELVVTLGFLGIFFLIFAFAFRRHEPVPLKDPNIRACMEFHE